MNIREQIRYNLKEDKNGTRQAAIFSAMLVFVFIVEDLMIRPEVPIRGNIFNFIHVWITVAGFFYISEYIYNNFFKK